MHISSYLLSPNVWWNELPDGFVVFDGDDDMDDRVEGPALKDFRSCSLVEVQKQPSVHWKYNIENDIKLPTNIGDFVLAIK